MNLMLDSEAERSARPPDERGRGRRWYALLSALIGVTGLAAGCAEAQSNARTVEAVSFAGSPAQGDTYELGEKIEVTVRFDRAVEWYEGRAELALTVGDHIRLAQARSISVDGRDLRFAYTVRAEDRDGTGISIPANALSLDEGTVRDRAGTTFTEIASDPVTADVGRKVDGRRATAPRIGDIIHHRPARGRTYRRGDRIEVTVAFDRAVSVTGVPQLVLIIGTETRRASFVPAAPWETDPERSIRFCYTVRPEDRDDDGYGIPANALSLNGGAITLAGAAETDAVLTHGAVGTSYSGRVDGRTSAAHNLRMAAARFRNRVVEFAVDILLNFVSSVRYSMYPVDAEPCPPAN